MMQNKLIGLTGGISTGKSTVTEILKNKGYTVIDADEVSRGILNVETEAYKKVVEEFGRCILNGDKTINRCALGDIVFKNKECREKLNSITHPYILEEIYLEIKKHQQQRLLFLDMPLLFEIKSEFEKYNINIDEVWLVYAKRETQLNRLMKRDKIDLEFAEFKINSQMDIDEKLSLSDVLIDNNGTREELIENIELALDKYNKS